jgi:hypothetical protein
MSINNKEKDTHFTPPLIGIAVPDLLFKQLHYF